MTFNYSERFVCFIAVTDPGGSVHMVNAEQIVHFCKVPDEVRQKALEAGKPIGEATHIFLTNGSRMTVMNSIEDILRKMTGANDEQHNA